MLPGRSEVCINAGCLVNNSLQLSPLREARACGILCALDHWKQFSLSPDNIKILASQASMTPAQAERALDDLASSERVRFRVKGQRIYVERVGAESEASR
jgi:hypothetical protein